MSTRIQCITRDLPEPGKPCSTSRSGSSSDAFTHRICCSKTSSFNRLRKCTRKVCCSWFGGSSSAQISWNAASRLALAPGLFHDAAALRSSSKGARDTPVIRRLFVLAFRCSSYSSAYMWPGLFRSCGSRWCESVDHTVRAISIDFLYSSWNIVLRCCL